jgi:hypothetical protein
MSVHSRRSTAVTGAAAQPLSGETLLHRLPEVKLRLLADETVEVHGPRAPFVCGRHALSVLETFTRPTRLSDGLRHLAGRAAGLQDCAELMDTIVRLYRAGVLLEAEAGDSRRVLSVVQPDPAALHVRLLNDRTRVAAYLRAIEEVVRPGQVVVDIGTGTGVLAIAAARAGARHVYAIEAGIIADTARRVVAANGLADRITVLRGWSTQVELPECADAVVSEILGNEPLAEGVIEATRDALQRMAHPEACLVPSRVRLFALPVDVPPSEMARRSACPERIAQWREWYGIELGPLQPAEQSPPVRSFIPSHAARTWARVAAPALLKEIELREPLRDSIEADVTIQVQSPGQVSGVLIYFEAELSPSVTLSQHPVLAEGSSWRMPLWVLPRPLQVAAGDSLRLSYCYGSGAAGGELRVSRQGAPAS